MLEVLNQNYILSARAKGLSKREIVLRHSLKNALFPIVSVLGPLTASILMGSFAIEKIFSIPGLGHYLVSSVQEKDYTMVIGISLFTSLVLVLVNTVTDILYSVIDPRVKL
ncbi:MAG: Oligopeptide transport system permease protein OppB [Firmicutes bacterium ADurb.Bin419]|nr:MAG: Oligopeptide transport system permease protein OppB [Firmicutes bacterium ADurb.Bin419]